MTGNVDLRQLAIDRSDDSRTVVRPVHRIVTRYILPFVLILGFLSLVTWASRDLVFPPRSVGVMPVFSTTSPVQPAGTPLFNAAGWIEPRPTPIRVAALAPGVVEKLLVVEDQPLKAGDRVAELVKDDARLSLNAATAVLALREAELGEAQALLKAAEIRFRTPVHLEASFQAVEASLAKTTTTLRDLPFEIRRAEADREVAQADLDGKTASKGVVRQVDIDTAASRLKASAALVAELQDRDKSLRREQTALSNQRDAVRTQLKLLADETEALEQARAKVNAASARLKQATVVVATAQLQLERMTIVAPADGRVFHLVAHPGARIGSGMTHMEGHDGSTIVTLYRPDMLQIRVDVRFEDIPKVALGQSIEIRNPAISAPLTGEVLFISSEADIQKNTLEVKVAMPDAPDVIKPEMLVDVTFLAPESADPTAEPSEQIRLFVPKQLIREGDGGPIVWVADQLHNVARRARIETRGLGSEGRVEVTQGLTVSSRLIVTGIDGMQDGDRIRVTREEATTPPGRPRQ